MFASGLGGAACCISIPRGLPIIENKKLGRPAITEFWEVVPFVGELLPVSFLEDCTWF